MGLWLSVDDVALALSLFFLCPLSVQATLYVGRSEVISDLTIKLEPTFSLVRAPTLFFYGCCWGGCGGSSLRVSSTFVGSIIVNQAL